MRMLQLMAAGPMAMLLKANPKANLQPIIKQRDEKYSVVIISKSVNNDGVVRKTVSRCGAAVGGDLVAAAVALA
jgi:hypothetical protein